MNVCDRLLDTRPIRSNAAFRRWWAGSTLSVFGGQLTTVAVLYQTWESTGSSLAVGGVGIARAVPAVLFGLLGGSVADSVDRRRLVLLTTSGQFACAGALTSQALAGLGSWWLLLVLVAAQEICGATGAPARRSFTARLLPEWQLPTGMALNHLGMRTAMLSGPVLAGVIIAAGGVEGCYLLNAVTFAAAFHAVLRLPSMCPESGGYRRKPAAIGAGLRFVASRPELHGAFLADVLATVLAMPTVLFPMINEQRFGGSPETLGLFWSALSLGGIAAGLASGPITRLPRPGVVMLTAAGIWAVALTGFGVSQQLWLLLGCLTLGGTADTISVISRGALVQLAIPDSHRGRISAVDHIVGASGPDLGEFRGGLVAAATSATFAAVSGALCCGLGILALAVTNRPLRRFTVPKRPAGQALERG
ncbi:Predicted arabinose efflux permease, MFS family [Actinopolyspora alba]|uniref:Predicted arabinose efflux permease, MFS family n=1 Tax=Actinopolyspora alba TaxID=673379 RepID=A0A1I1X1M5_9ACTN|nr:MFS transporter [Actinopolyspora alba]SFD99593.1 Predicted arabinose efflux permease, MFS family [Actinopolyspora alba]